MRNRRGIQAPPVPQIWCNSDQYSRSYGILKKMARAIFLWSAAILRVSAEPNRFSNCATLCNLLQFPGTIGRGILNLVALALTVTYSTKCAKRSRKKDRQTDRRTEHQTPGQKQNVSPSYGDTQLIHNDYLMYQRNIFNIMPDSSVWNKKEP